MASVTGERIGTPIVIQPEDRDRLAEDLQQAVVDLTSLSLDGKQAHWHVTGEHFMSVHQQLDRIVEDTRRWIDQVAERAVTLGMTVDGRAETVSRSATASSLPTGWIRDRDAVELMSDRIEAVVARLRRWLEAIGGVDLATQDLVLDVVRGLEMHLWMLQAQRP
jgi:starvation-inducible DNA-binding protein